MRPFEWGVDWISSNGHHGDAADAADALEHWVEEVDARQPGLLHARRAHPSSTSSTRQRTSSDTGEAGTLRFPSALATPHPENNIVVARWFPSKDEAPPGAHTAPRPCRRRLAAVELRRRRPHRPVAAAGAIRRLSAASQPAVSRLAHAARAHARRLHRQLEHRAHGAGVPAGRARRATRHPVAVRSGVRAHRHPRHQPRFVSVAPDVRARAEDSRTGAQPRVAVVCGRRVARSVDSPRPRRIERAHRSRAAAAICGGRSARTAISTACATRGRCSCTRNTT